MVFFKNGQTSVIVRVKLRDSSSTTGAGLTGLTSASSGLIVSTIAENEAATTRYRASSSEIETISTLGTFAAPTSGKCRFKEVDATNHPGLYEIQIADARWAVSSARSIILSVLGATNLVQVDMIVQLTSVDPYDTVRAGLTALPNANAEAAGGLYTRGTGAGQINQDANGRVDTNAKAWAGTATTLSSGVPDVNIKTITAGIIAAASFASGALDAVWSTATRLLTAGTNIVLAKGVGVTGFNDIAASAIIDDATPFHGASIAAIKAKTDNLPASPAAVGSAMTLTAAYDAAKTASQAGDAMALTTGERTSVGTAVWASATRSLTTFGTLVSDIWAAVADSAGVTTLLSRLTSTRAGLLDNLDAAVSSRSTYAGADTAGTTTLLGRLTSQRGTNLDHLDADVSTRLATSGYTAPDNADIVAIKAKTDNLPASPAATGDAMTLTSGERTAIANALLDLSNGVETSVTVRQSLRLMAAVLLGKVSGADTDAPVFRDVNDTKDRVTATTTADGNRTAVTLDAS
jgi:hypothetical protein